MNRLKIFLIAGLFIMLGSCSETQETLLSCKWESGKVGKRIIIKGEEIAKDIIIGLNIPQKKITKIVYGTEVKNVSWSDDKIKWSVQSKPLDVDVQYILSRISGALEIVFDDREDNVRIKNYYKCDKAQKKF